MVLSAGAALGLLAAMPQTAQAAALLIDGNVTDRPFTFHWMVDTNDNERLRGSRTDWQAMIDFGALPVQRNAICLYEHWFLLDVRTHGMSITQEAGFNSRYAATITRMLDERVPAGFAGMVCVDIEFHPKIWGNRTGGPGLHPTMNFATHIFDDWYRYIDTRRPELIRGKSVADAERALADSFEQATRDLYTQTIAIMRARRPDAKFGFYGIPGGARHANYGRPAPNPFRDVNDRLRWLVDLADVQFLPLYQNRFTIPDGATQTHWWRQMTIAQSKAWINENVAEARRLAPDKPVYVLAMCRYPETLDEYGNQWLDDLALDSMFRQPKRAGADGIVIWDFISSQAEYNALRSYLTERVFPIIAETATRPPTPPQPPSPPEPPAPPQPPSPPEPPAPPQPPSPPEPPAPPQPPSPPEPPAPPQPPSPPEPPAPPQPPSPPEPPAPPQPPSPPEPPAPPQPPALGGDGGGTPPTPPPAPGAGDGPAGGSGEGSGQNPPAPPVPNPFARGDGGTLGGGGGGGMSPPTPPAPPSPSGGSGGQGGQGGTSGGASPGGTGGTDGGTGGQGFRPATPGAGGGQPTVGPVPNKGGTATPAPARRIGITKGGRVIDLVPRTKVVTGAAPLRRTLSEQVAPPQIRTRNLTPTPILAASAGQPRSTTARQQATRTTVWWKRLAAADDSKH
jgi:hypothetical protein